MKVRRFRSTSDILDYRLHGADAASVRYNVDARTLKRWAAKEPTGWQREEEVNRLLAVSKRIAGKATYRDAVVAAGIATDKLRRRADRAARQALVVHEIEAARNPIAAAVNRLDDRRKRLTRDLIDAYVSDLPEPDPDALTDESLARLNEWIDRFWPCPATRRPPLRPSRPSYEPSRIAAPPSGATSVSPGPGTRSRADGCPGTHRCAPGAARADARSGTDTAAGSCEVRKP